MLVALAEVARGPPVAVEEQLHGQAGDQPQGLLGVRGVWEMVYALPTVDRGQLVLAARFSLSKK